MVKNILKIIGKIEKEPKIEGSKVYLTLHTDIDNRDKSESVLYVELTQNQWGKVKHKYLNSEVIITGQIQARKTKNGIPLIFVKANNITLSKSTSKKITIQEVENRPKVSNPPKKAWFKNFEENQFIEIDVNSVELVEKDHLTGTIPYNLINGFKSPIAIRPLENNKYALVAGVRGYFSAKLMNTSIKAYITDLTHKEFVEKYCYENKK